MDRGSGSLKLSQPCQDQKGAVSGNQGLELVAGARAEPVFTVEGFRIRPCPRCLLCLPRGSAWRWLIPLFRHGGKLF